MTAVLAPLPIEIQPWQMHDHTLGGSGNLQWIYKFPNGYVASVVQGPYTYGGSDGLYEVGIGKWNETEQDWHLTYKTPITDDVLGGQSVDDVAAVLVQVAALPAVVAS